MTKEQQPKTILPKKNGRETLNGHDSMFKIPGEVMVASSRGMSMIEESMLQGTKNMGDLTRAGREIWDEILSLSERRLDELTKGDGTITNPFEVMMGFWEIGALTGAAMFKKNIDAWAGVMEQAGEGSRLLLEAKNTKLEGITPYEVVAQDGFTQLLHFKASVPEQQRKQEPVFFGFPPMNQWPIADIMEGKSFVQALVNAGFDIYLVSSGGEKLRAKEPGWKEERNKTFDHYVLTTYPKFIEKASEISGSKKINMIGYCLGTQLAAAYLAVQKEVQPDIEINSTILLTPTVKYDPDNPANELFEMASDPSIDIKSVIAANEGKMDGGAIDWGARLRNPQKYIIDAYNSAYQIAGEPEEKQVFWKKMAAWLAQQTDFPGPMWETIFDKNFRENQLAEGRLALKDEDSGKEHRVDFNNIDTPILLVRAGDDDIVDKAHCDASVFPNSKVEEVVKEGAAHINLILGGKKNGTYKDCIDWLNKYSTKYVPAPVGKNWHEEKFDVSVLTKEKISVPARQSPEPQIKSSFI